MTVFIFSFSFLFSFFLYRFFVPYLSLRVLDVPNSRSSHSFPTPRGGGVVFVLVPFVACIFSLLFQDFFDSSFCGIIFLALPLSLVGFLDDLVGLSARHRFYIQIVTSFCYLSLSPLVFDFFKYSDSVFPYISLVSVLVCLLLVLLFVALINFVNFMDGMDGLVAGCMVVAIGAFSFAHSDSVPLWSLLGSLLCFLLWNWSPAKVFMGDVGSTFLGAVFGGLVLHASSSGEAFGFLLVATPLLADSFLCVLRRLLAGQRVFLAHRLHLFQRLHQAGWPHSRVSLIYIAATVALAVAMLAGGLPWVFSFAVVVFFLGVWLDQRFAVPFSVSSKC